MAMLASEGAAARDTERVGVGQWVAKERLQGRAGDREGGADGQAEQYARQAEAEKEGAGKRVGEQAAEVDLLAAECQRDRRSRPAGRG